MTHHTTPDFWERYGRLPARVQRTADKNYALLKDDPRHPSLHFKPLGDELWSVRVGIHHRALATREGGVHLWFWIGTHAEYDRLIGT